VQISPSLVVLFPAIHLACRGCACCARGCSRSSAPPPRAHGSGLAACRLLTCAAGPLLPAARPTAPGGVNPGSASRRSLVAATPSRGVPRSVWRHGCLERRHLAIDCICSCLWPAAAAVHGLAASGASSSRPQGQTCSPLDVWCVVNDYCGQAVGKLQAESMMSTATSLFSQ
jgi:hypothetical protein